MTFGGEGIKIWWRESIGGDFSRWEGMSEFLAGGGIPTSRENTGNYFVVYELTKIAYCEYLSNMFSRKSYLMYVCNHENNFQLKQLFC